MITFLKFVYGHFEDDLIAEIVNIGIYKKIPKQYELISQGNLINSIPLVISGNIKVFRENSNGNEILMYYIERGNTCAMTLTCCKGNIKSKIKAITETETELIMIPVHKMEIWTSKYKSWRNFILNSYSNRLNEILFSLDSVAFENLDQRLLQFLENKEKINNKGVINYTHQKIAIELNSTRVAVSRLLKKLENQGKIKMFRNQIQIIPK